MRRAAGALWQATRGFATVRRAAFDSSDVVLKKDVGNFSGCVIDGEKIDVVVGAITSANVRVLDLSRSILPKPEHFTRVCETLKKPNCVTDLVFDKMIVGGEDVEKSPRILELIEEVVSLNPLTRRCSFAEAYNNFGLEIDFSDYDDGYEGFIDEDPCITNIRESLVVNHNFEAVVDCALLMFGPRLYRAAKENPDLAGYLKSQDVANRKELIIHATIKCLFDEIPLKMVQEFCRMWQQPLHETKLGEVRYKRDGEWVSCFKDGKSVVLESHPQYEFFCCTSEEELSKAGRKLSNCLGSTYPSRCMALSDIIVLIRDASLEREEEKEVFSALRLQQTIDGRIILPEFRQKGNRREGRADLVVACDEFMKIINDPSQEVFDSKKIAHEKELMYGDKVDLFDSLKYMIGIDPDSSVNYRKSRKAVRAIVKKIAESCHDEADKVAVMKLALNFERLCFKGFSFEGQDGAINFKIAASENDHSEEFLRSVEERLSRSGLDLAGPKGDDVYHANGAALRGKTSETTLE